MLKDPVNLITHLKLSYWLVSPVQLFSLMLAVLVCTVRFVEFKHPDLKTQTRIRVYVHRSDAWCQISGRLTKALILF